MYEFYELYAPHAPRAQGSASLSQVPSFIPAGLAQTPTLFQLCPLLFRKVEDGHGPGES